MRISNKLFKFYFLMMLSLAACINISCTKLPVSCPQEYFIDLSKDSTYSTNDNLLFQFPLDDPGLDTTNSAAYFGMTSSGPQSKRKHHAAEDYYRPAGTPVYAMADGQVSFSGPMGGYGWLIIIDHHQANLYSLYGHLSPSRWRMKPGLVKKGELIAYLGNSDENGGSTSHPLDPHLHFGIRVGQRRDYPGQGNWRWQAGWIKLCPQHVGWLHPSLIISNQEIPIGGFKQPTANVLIMWRFEIILTLIYLFGGICLMIYACKKNKPLVLIIGAAFLVLVGWIFSMKDFRMSYVIFTMAIIIGITGIYRLIRLKRNTNAN